MASTGSSTDAFRLDDRDSQISYTPIQDWILGGSSGEYMSTTVGTRTAGAQMRFTFTGTYVAVYGTISHNLSSLPASNIFTLSSASNPSKHVVTWTASPAQIPAYNSKFYESPTDLKYGTYTITMDVGVRDSETWIDYLEFRQGNPESSTNSASTTASDPSTPGPSQTNQTSTKSSDNSQLSTGAIAGIAVGGAIVLILALALVFFWRRKRRYDSDTMNQDMGDSGVLEPFPYNATSINQPFVNSTSNLSSTAPRSSTTQLHPSRFDPTELYNNASQVSSGPSTANSDSAVVPRIPSSRSEKSPLQRNSAGGVSILSEQPPSYQP